MSKLKRTLPLLLALVFLAAGLLPAPSASAQDSSGLKMTATSAYGGYFKYGEWLPVWIELENQGRDVESAEVRVLVNSSQGQLVFASPVSLPSGSRKRFPLYVLPNNFSRELEVQLVSEDSLLLSSKVAVRPQANINYMVGIIAPERGALALINGIKLPGQERAKVLVDLTLSELPDRAEGLRSFDLVVINDTDTSGLSPEQSAALEAWVNSGGLLVIGGGAGAQRTAAGLPEGLLPLRVTGTTELSPEGAAPLADFSRATGILSGGPYVVASGDVVDGEIIAGDQARPLVVTGLRGEGQVQFITLDLAGLPFNGWPGTGDFWLKLIGSSGMYPENMPYDVSIRQYRANSLFYALSNIPSLDLPSIKGLSILLGIYILAVGPLNYVVLRRLRRTNLAWVTIPAITAVFTAAAFGIGYTMRGSDLVLNKISLIQAKANGNALVTSYLGLFSPRQQSYEVIVNGEGLVSPMSGYDAGGWGSPVASGGGEMVFVQGQPSIVKGLTVNQWAMQSFMSEGGWEGFGALTGDLRIENDALVGTVRNETSYRLTDVVVAVQSRFARLGDLEPGQEANVDIGLASLQSDRFGPPLSYKLFQERYMNTQMPRSVELRSNIISSVFENGPYMKLMLSSRFPASTSSPFGGVLMFGWIDQAPPSVSVSGSSLSQQVTGLVYTSLDYHMPDTGVLTLPPGLVPGTLTVMPRDSGTCGPMGTTSIHMGRGEAEFEFQIPDSLRSHSVETLKLAIWRDVGVQMELPQVSIYQWAENSWTTIQNPIQGTNVIQDAEPYVSDTGVIRVRLNSTSENFGCTYLDMGLEAIAAGQGGGS